MDTDQLTPAQQAFIDSTDHRRCFFGGRQIGKTTALAFDALEEATDGQDVAITAPTQRQALQLFEIVQEQCSTNPTYMGRTTEMNMSQATFVGGGRIEYASIEHLVSGNSSPRSAIPHTDYDAGSRREPANSQLTSCKLAYDHFVVDEVDHIKERHVDYLLRAIDAPDEQPETISVAGTSVTNSQNIKPFVRSGFWFTVYDKPHDIPFIDDEHVNDVEKTMTPRQSVVELPDSRSESRSRHRLK